MRLLAHCPAGHEGLLSMEFDFFAWGQGAGTAQSSNNHIAEVRVPVVTIISHLAGSMFKICFVGAVSFSAKDG